MRTTQFIGLTKLAQEYVQDLKELESDTATFGMFNEKIPLRKWDAPAEEKEYRDNVCIREVVQVSPWSSGPMLFTCLEIDWDNGATSQICQWITHTAMRGQEYDTDKGQFWV